ncbi:MAG: DUF2341 domain-containing protein, partial [Candidatus Latescibacteria bacterium]|nr:DUF2341 domain-containing protein [Candidatus Latescibacterota bacterium]
MKRLPVLLLLPLVFWSCAVDTGPYRMKITIDRANAVTEGQRGFPVLVVLEDVALKSAANGGHVASEDGSDIYFTEQDGRNRLAHELADYDPARGYVEAWVRLTRLYDDRDTELYAYYGDPGMTAGGKPDPVWDDRYRLVSHKAGETKPVEAADLALGAQLTVEAWARTGSFRPEALMPLVAKWRILESFDRFDAFDAGKTDGLKTIGFFGAVFDGQYVYFAPQRYGHEEDSTHGYALRYNTQRPFKDPSSWEAYDAGNTDGLATRGHYGAVFDGRYVYFVPRGKNYGGATGSFNQFQSNLLRYDTHGGFKNPESWAAYDMGVDISKQSAAFDGRFIYFCPGYGHAPDGSLADSPLIIRYDTKLGFKDPESYRVVDVSKLVRERAGNYDGAAFDGRYVYFVPLVSAVVLRYDTRGDYGAASSWATYDASKLGMKMNVGAMFDGRYLYFAAYGNGVITRYDTSGGFFDDASWTSYDAAGTSGLDTAGFDGGFFDGRYVYFAPFVSPRESGGYNFHTNWLRYDTTMDFHDAAAWDAHDASNVDGLPTIGYNGGASDGRFLYLAPWQD